MPSSPDDSDILTRALAQAGEVLDRVSADNLADATPCSDWRVDALADHLVEAPAKFALMTRGDQPDWSAPAPHVTEDWSGRFRSNAVDLRAAWDEVDGDPPVPAAFQVAELAVHTWDLAKAVGYPIDRLDPEVAEIGHAFMKSSMSPEQRGDVFAPEVEAPADAGPYEALAAFAGRDV